MMAARYACRAAGRGHGRVKRPVEAQVGNSHSFSTTTTHDRQPSTYTHPLSKTAITMGSVVSLPTAIALALIAGGILYGFVQSHPELPQPVAKLAPPDDGTSTKKGKKKRGAQTEPSIVIHKPEEPTATPIVVPFPPVVPGSFEGEPQSSKSKPKKKKAKKGPHTGTSPAQRGDDAQSESSATAPESSTPVPRPKRKSPPVLDSDGPWTRVESRKKPVKPLEATTSTSLGVEQVTSDPGITTSVTGTSEPEPSEDEEAEGTDEREPENRRTLAERMLPKPRKTKVEEYVAAGRAHDLGRTLTFNLILTAQYAGNSGRCAYCPCHARGAACWRAACGWVLVGRL